MTSGLDIVTNDAGEQVRTARARDTGEEALVALYRLAQMVRVHDVENQAFQRALEQTHRAVLYYCLHAGSDLVILFAERVVLIGGQLLQGSRGAYEAAAELGEHLLWCGGAELTIQRDVQPKDLKAFAEALGMALRTKKGAEFKSPTQKIRLRSVAESVRVRGLTLERLKYEQRLVRTYASAVVVMRRLFEALRAGRMVLPRRLKRIAQNLVDLSQGRAPAFLGVTEVRNANHDDAGRAVNTAILAVAAAKELTDDRLALSQIAMAALMHDVGRPRAESKMPKGAIAARLSDYDEDRLPSGTAVLLTGMGRLNEPTIARTVITFEALWLKRRETIGEVYDGELEPTLQARIIAIARKYNDLLTPEPGLAPPLPDYAIATLASQLTDSMDRTVLRMLASALGLLPTGTVVQLVSGETAEVLASQGEQAGAPPRLKLVTDARGGLLSPPRLVDLAKTEGKYEIAKVVSVDGWAKGLEPSEEGEAEPEAAMPSVAPAEPSSPSVEAPSSSSSSLSLGWQAEPPSSRATAPPRPPVVVMPEPVQEDRTVYEPSPYGAQTEETDEGTQFYRREANPALQARPLALPERSTAQGNLKNTPLPHVLVYMLDRGFTGSLVLRDPSDQRHIVYFEGGVPQRVHSDNPIAPIGEELIATRQIAPPAFEACVMAARQQGTGVAEFLVQQGLVSEAGMAKALRSQLLHQIEWLVKLPEETTYDFFQEFDALANWRGDGLASCEPLDIILAANRVWRAQSRIINTLTKIADNPIVLQDGVDLTGLSLTPEEQTLLDIIRSRPYTMPELYNQYAVSDKVVNTLLYTLLVTRQLALPGQQKPPMRPREVSRMVQRPAIAPPAQPLEVPPPSRAYVEAPPSPSRPVIEAPPPPPPVSRPVIEAPPPPPPVSRPVLEAPPPPPASRPVDSAPLRQRRQSFNELSPASQRSIATSTPLPQPSPVVSSQPPSDRSPMPRSMRVPPPWREDPARAQRPPVAQRDSVVPSSQASSQDVATVPPPYAKKMPRPWVETKRPSVPVRADTVPPVDLPPRAAEPDPIVESYEENEDTPAGEIPIEFSEGEYEQEPESDSHPSFPSFGTSPSAVLDAVEAVMGGQSNPPSGATPSPRGVDVSKITAKATARGDLTATPMVHILLYMLDHSATGSVILREPEGTEHLLEFRDGSPSKVKAGRPISLLGDMLAEIEALDRAVVEQSVGEAALIDAPLGEFLVLQNLIQRSVLEQVLQEQMIRKLMGLANQPPGTTYAFYRDISLLQNWGGKYGLVVEPLQAILATVRAWTDRNRIRGTLYKMKDRKLVLNPQADVSCLISDDVALSILAAIEPGDSTVFELYRRRLADEEEINSLVYTLAVMRFFDFSAAKGPPMGLGHRAR